MLASIVHFLKRIGKLDIIPIADSYLLRNTFKKNPNMAREVVRTNYASLSPYNNSVITSLSDENDLLVWFSPSSSATIHIPEAFLLYRTLMKRENRDRISIFNTDPAVLIIIKNGRLTTQSVVLSTDETFIDKLKREHSIETVECYNAREHEMMITAGYSAIGLNHYRQLFSIDLPDTTSLKSTLEVISTPISLLILIALGYHYGMNYHLTQKLEESKQTYREGKGAMIPIKHRLDAVTANKQKWDNFISDVLVRPDALSSTYPLIKIARDTNTTLKYIKVSGGKVETVVETPSATTFLKAIVKTKQYENVKLEFSKTDTFKHIDNAKIIAQVIPFDVNGTQP